MRWELPLMLSWLSLIAWMISLLEAIRLLRKWLKSLKIHLNFYYIWLTICWMFTCWRIKSSKSLNKKWSFRKWWKKSWTCLSCNPLQKDWSSKYLLLQVCLVRSLLMREDWNKLSSILYLMLSSLLTKAPYLLSVISTVRLNTWNSVWSIQELVLGRQIKLNCSKCLESSKIAKSKINRV